MQKTRAAKGKRSTPGRPRKKPALKAASGTPKKSRMASGERAGTNRGRAATRSRVQMEVAILLIDRDVLEWYRAESPRWRARMNAVLKAYRDATP